MQLVFKCLWVEIVTFWVSKHPLAFVRNRPLPLHLFFHFKL